MNEEKDLEEYKKVQIVWQNLYWLEKELQEKDLLDFYEHELENNTEKEKKLWKQVLAKIKKEKERAY